MNYSTGNFIEEDSICLSALIKGIEKSIRNSVLILIGIAVLCFFIPIKFLPKTRNIQAGSDTTLFEWFGPFGFLLFILLMTLIFYGINIYDHKYFKLKQDNETGRKIIFNANIKSLSQKKSNHGVPMMLIKLENNALGIKKAVG